MKWKKFEELAILHPYVYRDLQFHAGSRVMKELVRTKVGFIAFRPFDKLDLTAKSESRSEPFRRNNPHCIKSHYESVEYIVSFHVEGEREDSRLRFVGPLDGGRIQDCIDHLVEWFEGCESFRGKKLIWERVTKRSVSGSWHLVSNINLEIYPFPPDYRPTMTV